MNQLDLVKSEHTAIAVDVTIDVTTYANKKPATFRIVPALTFNRSELRIRCGDCGQTFYTRHLGDYINA